MTPNSAKRSNMAHQRQRPDTRHASSVAAAGPGAAGSTAATPPPKGGRAREGQRRTFGASGHKLPGWQSGGHAQLLKLVDDSWCAAIREHSQMHHRVGALGRQLFDHETQHGAEESNTVHPVHSHLRQRGGASSTWCRALRLLRHAAQRGCLRGQKGRQYGRGQRRCRPARCRPQRRRRRRRRCCQIEKVTFLGGAPPSPPHVVLR